MLKPISIMLALVSHFVVGTCGSSSSKNQKESVDSTAIMEESTREFYDDMPNAFQGGSVIMVPNDFVPEDVDTRPEFPGGNLAMKRYIETYLEIPASVRESKIKGKVYTSFIISEEGEIEEPTVVKSLDYRCDREALVLLQYMPKWKPAMKDGKAVSVRHYLEIPFDK